MYFSFMMQLPDGANAIVIGRLGDSDRPLAFVGGNCSIQGFDHTGEEHFWTVSNGRDGGVEGKGRGRGKS